jgi:hypothetical protein
MGTDSAAVTDADMGQSYSTGVPADSANYDSALAVVAVDQWILFWL